MSLRGRVSNAWVLIQVHFQSPNPRPLPRACCASRALPVGPFWHLKVTLYQAKQGQMRKARTWPSMQWPWPVPTAPSELSNTTKLVPNIV